VLRRSLALLAVVLVAGSVLSSCGGDDDGGRSDGGSSSGSEDQRFEGTEWILDQAESGFETPTAAVVTAQFGADGRLSGNGGCNDYSTSYEVDGSELEVSAQIASTLRLCAGLIGGVETAYFARLPKARSYAIDGRVLTITTSGEPLVYRSLDADEALAGSWVVINYFRRGGVVSPVAGSTLTARFESGRISGAAGCNDYTGPYETDDTKIVIGPVASTLRACADPAIGQQETDYLAALDLVRTFSLAGGNLTFLRADGGIAVTYARA
jgi:heat shock protein HslJ